MLSAKCIGCLQLLWKTKVISARSTLHTPWGLSIWQGLKLNLSAYHGIHSVGQSAISAVPTFGFSKSKKLWYWRSAEVCPPSSQPLRHFDTEQCQSPSPNCLLSSKVLNNWTVDFLLLPCRLICWKQFSIRRLTAAATCRLHREPVRPLKKKWPKMT